MDEEKYTKEEIRTLFGQATEGTLPENFNDWAIADKHGWTIAHEAAHYGHLPKDFSQWTLSDENGLTITQIVMVYNNLSDKRKTKDAIYVKGLHRRIKEVNSRKRGCLYRRIRERRTKRYSHLLNKPS
jgi:hypothetical protein